MRVDLRLKRVQLRLFHRDLFDIDIMNQRLDFSSHLIERKRQLADFIMPHLRMPGREIPSLQFADLQQQHLYPFRQHFSRNVKQQNRHNNRQAGYPNNLPRRFIRVGQQLVIRDRNDRCPSVTELLMRKKTFLSADPGIEIAGIGSKLIPDRVHVKQPAGG
ncbi:hypothetical protein D3C77_456120 [compost metagenome]